MSNTNDVSYTSSIEETVAMIRAMRDHDDRRRAAVNDGEYDAE